MNKKKIYITILLVFLMFLIVLMKGLFIEDIREVAISNNNIKEFDSYLLREGKYKFVLPEGWDMEESGNYNSDIVAKFSNENSIYGSISIVEGNIQEICKSITNNEDNITEIKEDYLWYIINISNNDKKNKYYLRDYSEGKVLIIKYSYTKEKNSINVVFDYIAREFQ